MRYNDQYLSPGNVSCGTTISVFQLAICYAVLQPMYFTWQCAMRYGCGTVRHIAMLHWSWYRMTHCQVKGTGHGAIWYIVRWNTLVVVPHDTLSGERHCLWYRIAHCQVKYTGCGNAFHLAMSCVPRPVPPSNMSNGTTTSVFHLTICHTVSQPVYFSYQCVMRYLVPYDTLPGDIHWLWYCKIYCYVALVVVPH
jgi:hypothetical protein